MAQDFTSREVRIDDVMETGCGLVHRYWARCRGNAFAPAWGDFRLIELPPNIIPFVRVADVIDTDSLGHRVYEPGSACFDEIVEAFGADVVGAEDGRIDRKKLGRW